MKIWLVLIISITICGCVSPEVAIQKKYSKTSTPQLKLQHRQLTDAINGSGWEMRFGNPIAMAMMGPSKNDRIREKGEIERELLRRYMAGDKVAWMPIFD